MDIHKVSSKFVATTLVFAHAPGRRPECPQKSMDGEQWLGINRTVAKSLFSADSRLLARFESFLNAGSCGIVLARDNQWCSYGWLAPPGSNPPPHLPYWVRSTDSFWIFYCHTKEGFRGRGLYKQLLSRLVSLAGEKGRGKPVYVDTHPDNVASRFAILASGFRPCGMFTTYNLWLPRLGSYVLTGVWRRVDPHPQPPSPCLTRPRAGISPGLTKNDDH